MPAQSRSSLNRRDKMAYQTIVAAFDTAAHAQAAVEALKAGGFHPDDISAFDRNRVGLREPGLWQRMFGGGLAQHEADVYTQSLERGGMIVSVRVPDSEVAHATGILDIHRPIDAHDEVLRLAEEQLQVGKRMVETGRTRVRRFVTEREVSADVTLHEEHADVLRRAVTDAKYIGEIDWADATIEVRETAEQALVSKTARVVEEVGLRKIGSDHVETVHDKIRRQQVEIERLGPDGKPIPART